jgi:hypothetical protein
MNLEQLKEKLIEIVERPLVGSGQQWAESVAANREEMAAWSNLLHDNWPSPNHIQWYEWTQFIDVAKVAHSFVMNGKGDQHQREYLIANSILKP